MCVYYVKLLRYVSKYIQKFDAEIAHDSPETNRVALLYSFSAENISHLLKSISYSY